MTCIVAVKKDNKLIIGSDSLVGRHYKTSENICKLVEKENIVIGVSGLAANIQILEYLWAVPERTEKDNDYTYFYKRLVPSIKNLLVENNLASITNNEVRSSLYSIIIYKDKIFSMDSAFCCIEHDRFFAEGSGNHHAIGAMEAVYTSKTTKRIAEIGLEVAFKYDGGVNNNFRFIEKNI